MDLFDVVRAAPPPKNVREPKNATAPAESDEEKLDAGAGTETVGKIVDKSKTKSASRSPPPAEVSEVFNIDSESDEEVLVGAFELRVSPDQVKSQDAPISLDSGDDEDDKDSANSQNQPTKTKVEQKKFSKQPRPSKHHKDSSGSSNLKECMVRIKRLAQSEIDRLIKSPKLHAPGKRGRPRLSESSSPSKKLKTSSNKAYVKIFDLENGAKQRIQSPPPAKQKKSPKATAPTSMKFLSTKSLIKQFGKRFFECVVRIKRLKVPEKVVRTNQKSKSVSFSEAVEILGSKPRKSSSILCSTPKIKSRSKLNSSVPTRLQRVDATGNVLEDIELNSSLVLDSSTPTSSSRKSKSGRSSSSCNGGRRAGKLKRPALRVPTTDLASLRIDDSHEEDTEANEEYIVPNELPDCHTIGVRRAGTPNPMKRVTVTTTVSDDEGGGDAPDTKKSKKDEEQVKSQAKKTESDSQKLAKPVGAVDQEKVETELEQKKEEEAESEQIMTKPEQTEAQPKSKETDSESKTTKQTEFEQAEKQGNPEEQREEVSEEKESKPEAGLYQLGDEPPEVEPKSYYLNDSDATPDEVDSTATTPSPTPTAKSVSVAGEDAMEDDILDIQTSLDDVRELHTPTSPFPRLQIDEQRDDSRSERCGSQDSDSSFKSANQLVINTAAEPLPEESSTEAEPEPEQEQETPPHTQTSTTSKVTTEASNTTTQNTGSEAASGSGMGQTMFSPISAIPTLDDEDLDDLVGYFN